MNVKIPIRFLDMSVDEIKYEFIEEITKSFNQTDNISDRKVNLKIIINELWTIAEQAGHDRGYDDGVQDRGSDYDYGYQDGYDAGYDKGKVEEKK